MRVVFVSGKDNKTKDNNIREGVAKVGWGKGNGLLMVWHSLAFKLSVVYTFMLCISVG